MFSYKKRHPGGPLPRAQPLPSPKDRSTAGSEPLSHPPGLQLAQQQGSAAAPLTLLLASLQLNLRPWEWRELVFGHNTLSCVCRCVFFNKQMVLAAPEELISVFPRSCSSL